MTLWTPGGDRPEPPEGDAPGAGDLGADEAARLEELRDELEDARRRVRETPASVVVANHAMGLYELAAIHLTSSEPKLPEAVLAIDALSALVDSLRGRLGESEPTLVEALSQIRAAYLEVRQRATGPEPEG